MRIENLSLEEKFRQADHDQNELAMSISKDFDNILEEVVKGYLEAVRLAHADYCESTYLNSKANLWKQCAPELDRKNADLQSRLQLVVDSCGYRDVCISALIDKIAGDETSAIEVIIAHADSTIPKMSLDSRKVGKVHCELADEDLIHTAPDIVREAVFKEVMSGRADLSWKSDKVYHFILNEKWLKDAVESIKAENKVVTVKIAKAVVFCCNQFDGAARDCRIYIPYSGSLTALKKKSMFAFLERSKHQFACPSEAIRNSNYWKTKDVKAVFDDQEGKTARYQEDGSSGRTFVFIAEVPGVSPEGGVEYI